MATVGWLCGGVVLMVVCYLLWHRPTKKLIQEFECDRIREQFSVQREQLEAKFLELARLSGKPKGLYWEDCDFHSPVSLVRDRQNGQLTALVEVTIRFSAIPGGGMENVEAVSNLRHATAVFHHQQGRWGTGGRALFNMNPSEAIAHFQSQYERVHAGS